MLFRRRKGLSILALMVLLLCSCATYNSRIQTYYSSITQGNYSKADKELEANKLLKAGRNSLLYLLEKGRVAHLQGAYDTSNYFFNEADRLIEEQGRKPADVVVGLLMNPMMQQYKAEAFEGIMIHYYKALNYLYLNQPDEAIVEARRITLQNQQIGDNAGNKDKRYSKDAFSLMLQGLIYERSGDVNNAFIAYRNSAELYLNDTSSQKYYGVELPLQLKKDVLRTAYQNGFTDEVMRFERLFKMKYQPAKPADGGELVVFFENGMAPVKEQQDFFFSLTKGLSGFYFVDAGGNEIPFDGSMSFSDDSNVGNLNTLHVAFPKFVARPLVCHSVRVSGVLDTMNAEKVEDITGLAQAIQKQRFAKEMSATLSRLAVKKAAQYLVKGKEGAKNKELREGLSSLIDIYAAASEKADTRNWQTLPSEIYYVRIPLKKGENKVDISLNGVQGLAESKTFTVEGSGGLVFLNYAFLK
ncbi:COG3014 family protein [Desertivirga arenae]|uniref:COG3014 family protein n=1 Tax=Desertivirga arenae TaxID=2810309 RepID=UPI001A971DA9|nr:hypothetical protein [Pedobacter sp. SYSU D00823]